MKKEEASKEEHQQEHEQEREKEQGGVEEEGAMVDDPIEYLEPSYATEPDDNATFNSSRVKAIAQEVLGKELDSGKIEDKWIEDWADFGDDFESLSRTIADSVKAKCKKDLDLPRYKIVVQVSIGQMKDQSVYITSRCLWDTNTDNYASASYRNEYIWASCIVFGVYTV